MAGVNPARLKKQLHNTWLHPRYIGTVYLRAALTEARPLVHGLVLDVGSGSSPYRDLFEGRHHGYIRVDWPRTWSDTHPDVVADAQRLPFRDESFDTVLATELIEHLPAPQTFLAEVRRLLRPGGALIVSAPFLEPLHEEPRDFRRFTAFGLEALVAENGFTVERTWARGGWWSVVVGSFVNQTLFNWINPETANGRRSVVSAFLAPVCAVLQSAGWAIDRVIPSKRYALGYVVAASVGRRGDSIAPSVPSA